MARLRTAAEVRGSRTDNLRQLNVPQPIRVGRRKNGEPRVIEVQGQPAQVAEVRDCWKVLDRWWTEEPIDRTYYELLLEDGAVTHVFWDALGEQWYSQRVPPEPRSAPPPPEPPMAVRERMEREYREELAEEQRQKLTEGWA